MTQPTPPSDNEKSQRDQTNAFYEKDMKKLWKDISEALKELVGQDSFTRWFCSAYLVEMSETDAILAVESDMHQVWVEANYLPEVQTAFSAVSGMPCQITVVVAEKQEGDEVIAEKNKKSSKKENLQTKSASIPSHLLQSSAKVSPEVILKKLRTAGLNPQFSFSRFVVGQNNEFAQAACEAVATSKKSIYNPLFIHGDSGLGKTHLMQAIGQRMMKENPSARVIYLTCEKFTNEFIDALRKKTIDRFRRKYRRADILLIDDIQFLGGKERSQEEFFHTFNELLDLQNQIVLTSDRPASEIKNIEPRLISRFESGLTVELLPPGVETRLAILQRKMEDWDVRLSDDILQMLAERIQSNVRRLEGGLVRVATYASLGSEQITVERAEVLLKDILREEGQKRVNIDAIQKEVSKYFDLRLADMTSQRRPANIAYPRQVAMYLSRELTRCSLVEIGEAFGGRDHGTVIYACKKVKQSMEREAQMRDTVDILIANLQRK